MKYNELDNESKRILIDMQQLYDQFLTVQVQLDKYKGSMTWKTVDNRQYLYRLRGRRGYGKSLGSRSDKTEEIYQHFIDAKHNIAERHGELKAEITRQAKFCMAANISRVPKVAADVARVLQSEPGLDKLMIVGTHALYAYEVLAGVRIGSELLATRDIDLLWDTRNKITLAVDADINSLFSALQIADKTFERLEKARYAAANSKGFTVELIKPMPNLPMKIEPVKLGVGDDLEAVEISGLDWLLNQKPIEVIVIAEDGQPVNWLVPDPRLFAAHKLWLSKRDDRDPLKKSRDYDQALLTLELCKQYLSNYQVDDSFLKNIPKSLSQELNIYPGKSNQPDSGLSPGF